MPIPYLLRLLVSVLLYSPLLFIVNPLVCGNFNYVKTLFLKFLHVVLISLVYRVCHNKLVSDGLVPVRVLGIKLNGSVKETLW